jgi:hypothetical protein
MDAYMDDDFCPRCGLPGSRSLNVRKDRYIVCDPCGFYWWVGYGLSSSWRGEDEATWDRNRQLLARLTRVEPLRGDAGTS